MDREITGIKQEKPNVLSLSCPFAVKKRIGALSKTNQQIEVNIENSLNLKNIEEAAKDKIGMQKLNNNQKIYVELPKKDYVAPAAEQVIIDDDLGFFEKLIKGFTKSVE